MYRKLHYSLKLTISLSIIVTLSLNSVLPVQGYWQEDFTDNNLDEWLQTVLPHEFWNHTEFIYPSWDIQDGFLFSAGGPGRSSPLYDDFEMACKKLDNLETRFSFSAYLPENSTIFSFRLSYLPKNRTTGTWRDNYYDFTPDSLEFRINNDFFDTNSNDPISYQYTVIQILNHEDRLLGYMNDSTIEQSTWQDYQLNFKDKNVEIYKNGNLFMNSSYYLNNALLPYDSICFWTVRGSNARVDNIIAGESGESTSKVVAFLTQPIIMATLVVGILSASTYTGREYIKKKQRNKVIQTKLHNQNIISNVSKEFNLSNSSLYSLVSGTFKVNTKYLEEDFKQKVPQELLTYRYLMHPVRLAIMKLLDEEQKMKTKDIKYLLDIPWGEVSNHLKSLEEKGFVELVDEFNEDGHISQSVYILEDGRSEFQDLFMLLKEMTSEYSPYGSILSKDRKSRDDNPLFPRKG